LRNRLGGLPLDRLLWIDDVDLEICKVARLTAALLMIRSKGDKGPPERY
jgi:hypothetical protein